MGFYEPDTVYAPFLFPTLVKWHASLLHRSKKILYAKLPSGLQQPSYLIIVEFIWEVLLGLVLGSMIIDNIWKKHIYGNHFMP